MASNSEMSLRPLHLRYLCNPRLICTYPCSSVLLDCERPNYGTSLFYYKPRSLVRWSHRSLNRRTEYWLCMLKMSCPQESSFCDGLQLPSWYTENNSPSRHCSTFKTSERASCRDLPVINSKDCRNIQPHHWLQPNLGVTSRFEEMEINRSRDPWVVDQCLYQVKYISRRDRNPRSSKSHSDI